MMKQVGNFIWILVIGLWSCDASPTPSTTEEPVVAVVEDSNLSVDFFQENPIPTASQQAFLPLLDSSYFVRRDSFEEAFKQHYQVPAEHQLLGVQPVQLYGAPDSLFWVRFSNGKKAPSCPHPALEQHFILNHKGQFLYQNYVHQAQFLAHGVDSLPIFLTVEHNCEGEGRHHAYIWQEGQLLDILNTLFENTPLTFDAKEDSSVFQGGGALQPLMQDVNQDGYLDLLLQGKRLDLYSRSGKRFSVQRPYRRERVVYYFLYEPAKEIFVLKP